MKEIRKIVSKRDKKERKKKLGRNEMAENLKTLKEFRRK